MNSVVIEKVGRKDPPSGRMMGRHGERSCADHNNATSHQEVLRFSGARVGSIWDRASPGKLAFEHQRSSCLYFPGRNNAGTAQV